MLYLHDLILSYCVPVWVHTVGQFLAKSVLSALYIPMYFRTLCHCTSTVQYSVQYIGQCVSKSDLSAL